MTRRSLDETIPVTVNDNKYNIHRNAIGSKNLTVTTPEVVVTGKKKQPYRSAFDPTAAWDIPHAGLELIGKGMSYITPDWMEKAMPYLSPSQYVGMLQGKGLPGSKTNDGFGSSKQDQYLNEMFDLLTSKVPIAKATLKTSRWGYGVGRNIKHRNEHAYATISPFGYDNPSTRFKAYAKSILSGEPVYDHLGKPKTFDQQVKSYLGPSYGNNNARTVVANIARDEAWRKYLRLPSLLESKGQQPVYIPNDNGTFRYNMNHLIHIANKNNGELIPYLKDSSEGRVHDWITGAGGGVNQVLTELGPGVGADALNRYGKGIMRDTWDLHPFKDSTSGESKFIKQYKDKVAETAGKSYQKVYDSLYSFEKPYGRFAYNHLGGRYLNRLRYGDAPFPGLVRNESGFGYNVSPILQKIFNKISNKEVGLILGGKPFTLEQPFKYTKKFDINASTNDVKYKHILGWDAENIVPYK